MNEERILEVIEALRDAREREAGAADVVALSRAKHAALKYKVLVEAYAEGRIDGKNAEMRKAQEVLVLSEDMRLIYSRRALYAAKRDYAQIKAERQYFEDLLDAYIALLYASREGASESGRRAR